LLWQSLVALLRFLTTYAADLSAQSHDIHSLLTPLLRTVALAVLSGASFLPDPAAYDDLFYKLVENGHTLIKFKSIYRLPDRSPIDVLLAVSSHYRSLLEAEKGKGKMGQNLSPREVSRLIRQGYEGLILPEGDRMALDGWQKYREGEERGMVKKAGRTAVEDVRALVRNL